MISHLKRIIPFIIIALLAAGGVEAFYRITFNQLMQMSRAPRIGDAVAKVTAPAASVEKKQPDYKAILKRNLFGPPTKAAKPAATGQDGPDKLATTPLELNLLGTITGPPNSRRAIILDKKTKLQDIYYQGDVIQGALIKEIQRGKIILDRNGKDEVLIPETLKTNPAGATNPALNAQTPPETTPPPGILEGVIEPEPIAPLPNNQPEPAETGADLQPTDPSQKVLPPNMNSNQEKP